jgi:hypothetical protein
MKTALLQAKTGDLRQLSFTTAEWASLEWEDASEFSYQGDMYDVVRQVRQGGSVTAWCLSDEKETALLTAYLNTQKQTSENSSSNKILKILLSQYLPASVTFQLPVTGAPQLKNTFLVVALPEEATTITTPPPRMGA